MNSLVIQIIAKCKVRPMALGMPVRDVECGNINNCGDTVCKIEKRRCDKNKGRTKVFKERTFRYYGGYT